MRRFETVAWISKNWHIAAVACLVSAQVLLMALFIVSSSPTWDETAHLCGGLDYLKNRDYSVNPESGVLPQMLAALPALNCKFPDAASAASRDFLSAYVGGMHNAICGVDGDVPYMRARCMTALLNIACGLLLFWTARRLFGRLPAVLAFAVYAFLPLFLSNGALVTADMAVTFFSLASCLSCGAMFRRLSLWSFMLAALTLSALFLSKMSAPLVLPVLFFLALAKAFSSSKLRVWRPWRREWRDVAVPWRKLLTCLATLFCAGLVVFGAIWAAYGFRYSMSPAGTPKGDAALRYEIPLSDGSFITKAVSVSLELHALPEAYLRGFMDTCRRSQGRWAFLNGKISGTGFPSFFPQAFLMKTPPATIAAIALGVVAALVSLRRAQSRRRLFQLLPVFLFAALYLFMSLRSHLNIGVRHLMPAFPAMILLCALGFREIGRSNLRLARMLPFLLVASCALEAVMARSAQLAYFSPFYGGASQGYTHLVDSSLDWGQDLRNLKGAFEKNGIPTDGSTRVYLAYFGLIPAKDCGLNPLVLPFPMGYQLDSRQYPLRAGVYCVSATILQGVYSALDKDKFNNPQERLRLRNLYREAMRVSRQNNPAAVKRFAAANGRTLGLDLLNFELIRFEMLRRALLHAEPAFTVGGSIIVFVLDEPTLQAMLGDDLWI